LNIVIARTTKINALFLLIVLVAGIFTIISPSSFIIVEVQAQKAESEIEEEDKEGCISYNKSEKLISITCKHTDFADVSRQITDPNILKRESAITTTSNTSNDNNEKVWLLYAGLKVEKNAILDINSNDVTWLKIIPTKKSPNSITVEGILKVDSVKITS
jgi:mannuronan 5-epimerase